MQFGCLTNVWRARRFAALLLAAICLIVALPAGAATPTGSSDVMPDGSPYVTLDLGNPWMDTASSFSIGATVQIDRPTAYLESRLQIHNPSGSLMFQKTEVRNNEPTGTVAFKFERELADLNLSPGIYPVELRVRSDSGTVREWTVNETLILFDASAAPVPFSLIVTVSSPTATDPAGRFVVDPSRFNHAQTEVDALCQLILDEPRMRAGLAIPPVLLEEWAHIASGYETSGPEGVQSVEAEAETPLEYSATLDLLGEAIATKRLELLSVPYANPSIPGLAQTDRYGDITTHLERGLSAVIASIETSPSSGVVLADGLLPGAAIEPLAARGVEFAIVDPLVVSSAEETATSGPYLIEPTQALKSFVVLATDADAAAALSATSGMPAAQVIFNRSLSKESTVPLVASILVGPGRDMDIASLATCLAELADAPWVHFVTPTTAARVTPLDTATLSSRVDVRSQAPAGYWDECDAARAYADALVTAAGSTDAQAGLARDASLIAQDAAWAGPDNNWSSADRGRGFASSAAREAHSVLDAISISTQDMTLSSATGEVPVNIANASGKTLSVRVVTRARGIELTGSNDVTLVIRPQDNFFTVPVDLQSSLSGKLDVEVWAGETMLTSTEVTVRASYLDRLAILGGASLILVGLLLFIRHRIRAVVTADTISAGKRGTGRARKGDR